VITLNAIVNDKEGDLGPEQRPRKEIKVVSIRPSVVKKLFYSSASHDHNSIRQKYNATV
jgi:hypothetical protein